MESLIKKLGMPFVVLVWSAFYFSEVIQYSERNHYLIKPCFYLMVTLFIVNTVTDLLEWKREQKIKSNTMSNADESIDKHRKGLRLVIILLSMAAYVFFLPYLGYTVSSLVLLLFILGLMKVNKPMPLVVLPVTMVVLLYSIFKIFLGIPLPTGFIGF